MRYHNGRYDARIVCHRLSEITRNMTPVVKVVMTESSKHSRVIQTLSLCSFGRGMAFSYLRAATAARIEAVAM
jgi:hypothetical protein